jgi:hypothetical protein
MNDPQNPHPAESAEERLPGLPKQKPQRHTGTVGRLPKEVRDRINELILDGHTYREVIAELGESGEGLTEDYLSTWKSGGYAEWLRARERREDVLAVQEAIMDRALKQGVQNLSKATIQMAVTRAFQLLDTLPPESMHKTMDSNNFTRLLNALVKVADGDVKSERHELETAEREAKLKREKLAPKQAGLSDQAREEIEEHRFNPPPA